MAAAQMASCNSLGRRNPTAGPSWKQQQLNMPLSGLSPSLSFTRGGVPLRPAFHSHHVRQWFRRVTRDSPSKRCLEAVKQKLTTASTSLFSHLFEVHFSVFLSGGGKKKHFITVDQLLHSSCYGEDRFTLGRIDIHTLCKSQ